jgi:hypothetical protein
MHWWTAVLLPSLLMHRSQVLHGSHAHDLQRSAEKAWRIVGITLKCEHVTSTPRNNIGTKQLIVAFKQ